jgi:hypothetical protein
MSHLRLLSIVSNFEQTRYEEKLHSLFKRIVRLNESSGEITAAGKDNHSQLLDISWNVGHGDIFHNARCDSSVWPCPLVVRY